jgi:hypothetical protein
MVINQFINPVRVIRKAIEPRMRMMERKAIALILSITINVLAEVHRRSGSKHLTTSFFAQSNMLGSPIKRFAYII